MQANNAKANEMVISRMLNAPVELVFDAYTQVEHASQWWGPHGFRTTTSRHDLRPGGEWIFVMHGPDGTDYPNHITFLEIERPTRLVYDHSGVFHSEVTFEPVGNRTRVTMRATFQSAEALAEVVKRHKADQGGIQHMQNLAEYLARTVPVVDELVMERVFDAPRELVFDAWTHAEHLARWWGPRDFTNPVCEAELRVGGRIRIDMRAPDGSVNEMYGCFVEIHRPERLVLITGLKTPDGEIFVENWISVSLCEVEGGQTRMRLSTRVITANQEALGVLHGMEEGWSQSLERLGAFVTGTLGFVKSPLPVGGRVH